jgi:purine-binding chemotaxis protein CheW
MNGAPQADAALWLVCRAGTVLCALPIAHVVEVMRSLPVEPLAGAPDYVRGVSIIRGMPVAVVDASQIIGNVAGHPTRLIAVRTGARLTALAVDGVVGISAMAAAQFTQLPPLLGDTARDTVAAIGAHDGALLVCLQSGRLIPEDVAARLDVMGIAA